MQRRTLLQALAAAGTLSTLPMAHAQLKPPAFEPKRGEDYEEIVPPQPGGTNGKIEIIEFFSYMCPHCHEFEPRLAPWVAKLPADMTFSRVPVGFGRPDWNALARMYIVLRVMNLNAQMDGKVFDAIHRQRVNLADEKTRNEWVSKQGVDLKKFNDTWSSFGVETQFKRADQMSRDYKVQGVPSLAVNGRYMAHAGPRVFDTIAVLVGKLRKK